MQCSQMKIDELRDDRMRYEFEQQQQPRENFRNRHKNVIGQYYIAKRKQKQTKKIKKKKTYRKRTVSFVKMTHMKQRRAVVLKWSETFQASSHRCSRVKRA